MSRAPTGLGRGLSALLGEQPHKGEQEGPAESRGVREVEIGRIRANPSQPRVHFDDASLNELAESIAERGVLQPILLRPDGDGFMIIAGERRWRAAQKARLHAIPAIVRDIDDAATAELALIENIQREDLNALEEAEAYRQLILTHRHGQDEVARLGEQVAQPCRQLAAAPRSTGIHPHCFDSRADHDGPRPCRRDGGGSRGADQAGNRQRPFRSPDEALARKIKPGAGADIGRAVARAERGVDADVEALERQLSDVLGLRVKVAHHGTAGTVSLHYSSLDQLDMICQRLSGEPI
jgi:ParB family chromosome partitioning protein